MTIKQRRPWRDWISLVACMGFAFVYPMSFSTAGLFFIELAPHYGMGNKAITWIAACQSGIGAAFGLVSGTWIKKLGPRVVGIIATTLAVLGLLTGAFIDNIFYLYVSFGVMFGVGSSTGSLVAFTTSFRLFPNHRPLMGGIMAALISVGGFIWAPITEYLIQIYTWKGALIWLSGIHLHGYILSLLITNPTSSDTEISLEVSSEEVEKEKVEKYTVETNEQLKSAPVTVASQSKLAEANSKNTCNEELCEQAVVRPLMETSVQHNTNILNNPSPKQPNWKVTGLFFLIASTLTIACHMNFYTYIPILNEQNGYSRQKGALLLSVVNICSGVIRIPAGLLGNMRGVSCSLIYGLSVLGAAALSMSSVLCSSYETMMVMCACYGLCAGCYMSLQSPSLLEQINPKYLTVAMGLQMTTQGFAIFILHGSAGFILDAAGDGNILFFIYGSFSLVSAGIVLSLVVTGVLYRLRSTHHKKELPQL